MKRTSKLEYPVSKQQGKKVWNWRLRAANGEITGQSNQGYGSKAKAKQGFIAHLVAVASLVKV